MSKEKYSIFSITDLHMGNNIVKSDVMLRNYTSFLRDNMEVISKSDVFLITGDLTDSLLYTNSQAYKDTLSLMMHISRICVKLDLVLIYLEGTPSHEARQMENIHHTITNMFTELEFRYHNTLSYHTLPKLDMTYITVPDNISIDDEALFRDTLGLMRNEDKKKVDFIFSHQEYEEILSYPSVGIKSTALWSNLVNYYIINGHIHQFSLRDKVITTGALDFITHGDEELKGGVLITVDNSIAKFRHIKTKHYTKFKTLILDDDNLESIVNKIYKLFPGTKDVYHIRVIGNLPKEYILKIKKDLPLLRLKVERNRKEHKKIEIKKTQYSNRTISIEKDNICSLVEKELGDMFDIGVGNMLRDIKVDADVL